MSERKPVKVFKTGLSIGLQIAAWESNNGVSFTIQKRYKDKDTGEYKESKGFFASDLAALAQLAPAAIQFADDLYEQGKQSERKADTRRGEQPVKPSPNDDEIPF